MSMLKLYVILTLPVALYGRTAHAEIAQQHFTVGAGTSFTADAKEAVNFELTWKFTGNWRIKARLEQGLHSSEHTVSLVNFAESFERNSLGIFLERKLPSTQGISVAVGMVHFQKASSWMANPKTNSVYRLNGRSYSGLNLGQPEAMVNYRTVVPYLGFSWSSLEINQKGWGVNAEIGLMFNLDPELTIKSDNSSYFPLLNDDLQYEADKYVDRLKAGGEFLSNIAPRIGVTAIYQF